MRPSRLWSIAAACLAIACGSNTPEIPAEYLTGSGGAGSGGAAASYPAGPFGADEGSIIKNYSFSVGWSNPKAVAYDLAQLDAAPIQLSDFYNPTGAEDQSEVMLVNTAALWCQACRVEHADLDERLAEFGPRGLVILSTLFQDAKSQPAEPIHLQVWAQQFEIAFPFVLDPEYQMGDFALASKAPLNLVVDLRTMEILLKVTGDGGSIIWPLVEATLAARGR